MYACACAIKERERRKKKENPTNVLKRTIDKCISTGRSIF
jgi:hypothetical protein